MTEKVNLVIQVNRQDNLQVWHGFELYSSVTQVMRQFCEIFIKASNVPVFVCMIYRGRNLVDQTAQFIDMYKEGCVLFVHYYEYVPRPIIRFMGDEQGLEAVLRMLRT